ncbi:ATP-binding cassette domain-containing protein [Streptomyces sp. NPDC000070]|uniref:ATP-binding cassette domain-containing protein n=1 Tax=Streptomyces sp. NPDC000070 TaxID=3154240 RepID=UPI00331B203B
MLTKQLIDTPTAPAPTGALVTAPAAALAAIGVVLALLPYVDDLCQGVLARAVALTAQDRLFRAVNSHPGRSRRGRAEAGVHRVLSALPTGCDTMLTRAFYGENDRDSGVVLSRGQWQRVALARALLRTDRDLFVLDEPTSGLAPQAQAEVAGVTREMGRGRARLFISRRLSEVRTADRIVLLDGGSVAEQGPHEELMRRPGSRYAELFRGQAAGFLDGGGRERE